MNISNYIIVCFLFVKQFQFGYSKIIDRHRVVEGDYARPGEINYIVVTLHNSEDYKCGGGIIDDFYVLSAAHCFVNESDQFRDQRITVIAGTNDYNDYDDVRRVRAGVEKVYVPDNYKGREFPNDIALIKLKTSLEIDKHGLKKLLIPTVPANLTNRMAKMAGFGYDQHKRYFDAKTHEIKQKGSTSGLLRKADIKMFSNHDCQKFYKKNRIYDSYLCGKMVKKSQRRAYGICNGDSGSPLVYNSMMVGLVSWSHGCDERNVPLIYTRVNYFLDFINNAMKDITFNMKVKVFK